jgi:hypothetical protein
MHPMSIEGEPNSNREITLKKDFAKEVAIESALFVPFMVGGAEFMAFIMTFTAATMREQTDPVVFPLAALFGIIGGVGIAALNSRDEIKRK